MSEKKDLTNEHPEIIRDWITKHYGAPVSKNPRAIVMLTVPVMGGIAMGCGMSEAEAMRSLYIDLSTLPE